MIYEIIPATEFSSETIKRTDEDGKEWFIPIDPTNSDYQAYLASLDQQQAALAEKPTAKK